MDIGLLSMSLILSGFMFQINGRIIRGILQLRSPPPPMLYSQMSLVVCQSVLTHYLNYLTTSDILSLSYYYYYYQPHFRDKKIEAYKAKCVGQGHTTSQWQSPDQNLGGKFQSLFSQYNAEPPLKENHLMSAKFLEAKEYRQDCMFSYRVPLNAIHSLIGQIFIEDRALC